jgi:hypothetical protein
MCTKENEGNEIGLGYKLLGNDSSKEYVQTANISQCSCCTVQFCSLSYCVEQAQDKKMNTYVCIS